MNGNIFAIILAALGFLFYRSYNKDQINNLLNLFKLKKDTEPLDKQVTENKAKEQVEEQKREEIVKQTAESEKKVENEDAKQVADFFNDHK